MVSNSDGRAERHLENAGVREGIEFVVDSHRVGVEKPDPRIFAIALERLGTAPERALYVGDIRSVDETGARAAGLHFVLIDPWGITPRPAPRRFQPSPSCRAGSRRISKRRAPLVRGGA